MHGLSTYYWITPSDSLNLRKSLAPVYLNEFYSSTDYIKCCNQNPVDIFSVTKESVWDFNNEFKNNLTTLRQIVLKGRRKIQTIEKNWGESYKEKITVYATAVNGQFCKCGIIGVSVKTFESYEGDVYYRGRIYLPSGTYSLDNKFWTTEKAKNWDKDYSYLEPGNLQ